MSYPPIWCLAELPGTHGGTRICESFHLTAPNFTSRLWLSICLLLLPRKSDSRICLSHLCSIILAMRTMKTKTWLNWSILWILRASFYAEGTQLPIYLSQISRISEWEDSRKKASCDRWKKLRSWSRSLIFLRLELNLLFPKIEFFPTQKWTHEKNKSDHRVHPFQMNYSKFSPRI